VKKARVTGTGEVGSDFRQLKSVIANGFTMFEI
jgi:hypothetical protein